MFGTERLSSGERKMQLWVLGCAQALRLVVVMLPGMVAPRSCAWLLTYKNANFQVFIIENGSK